MSRLKNYFKARRWLSEKRTTSSFLRQYSLHLKVVKTTPGDWLVWPSFYDDSKEHPKGFEDHECSFASRQIAHKNPEELLDVGSYRRWLIGIMASRRITTLDVRAREPESSNETVLVSDAKRILAPDNHYDMITSLCALEHFGLGRYGDEFDLNADRAAFAEMKRVLKPGGHIVFSTTLTRSKPQLAFNAHRIYTLPMIHTFCDGLVCEEESFFSFAKEGLCDYGEVCDRAGRYDVYMGCWQKNT